MRRVFMGAALLLGTVSVGSAETITFSGASGGPATYTEGGFVMTNVANSIYYSTTGGNPGGYVTIDPSAITDVFGIMTVQESGGGEFSFAGLDMATFTLNDPGVPVYVSVDGYLDGTKVGDDTYYLSAVEGSTANWTTETATSPGLAGVKVDELYIYLNFMNDHYFYGSAMDNLVLDPIATPEPGSLWLLGTGMAGVFGAMRGRVRRRG